MLHHQKVKIQPNKRNITVAEKCLNLTVVAALLTKRITDILVKTVLFELSASPAAIGGGLVNIIESFNS